MRHGCVRAFSALSAPAHAIWAKSGDDAGHGLLAHLLDVAAVVETQLELEPGSTSNWAAAALGVEPETVGRWLAALAGLHDFGKAVPGFQAKWPEGMRAALGSGLPFPASACGMDRHDLASAALLGRELHGFDIAGHGWLQAVVQAVSAHHGYHFLPDEINRGRPLGEPHEWGCARREILDAFWQVLAPQGCPQSDELSLSMVNWLAGLTSAADWIASNPRWFPLGERGLDALDGYYDDARRLARQALADIGWRTYLRLLDGPAGTDDMLARIVARPGLIARPLQRVGDRLLQQVHGPALLLVEAPMGEGKTELAFLAHLRLQAANDHRGLYVALPTQATGNALFERALTFLRQFAGGSLDVQLVHGGAAMNEGVRHLRDIHLQGVGDDREESLSASAWFAQRKRPLLSPYGVGTVDQALFAVLNVKHHFVRLWGLGNRVVVLDEVHAYDTYTNGLIVVLLRWLRALDCSVVLMSATLPAARRNELLRAWGVSGQVVPELAYPRLLLADDGGIRGEHFAARPLAPIHLGCVAEGVEVLAEAAIEQLDGGGCGALIVNTVDRAQRLYRYLCERLGDGVELLLFHARFPADQRAARERQVLDAFGTTGTRPERALLIATQVAEQSLDIDFDFMLSDLAPVDLLLQRAGRLHRHDRSRPASHRQAHFRVAGLGHEALPELKDTAWAYVYDAYILLRTWALLRDEAILDLPGDIDRLVQAVYGDDPLPEGLEEVVRERIETESYGEYLAKVKNERLAAQHIAIDPDEEWQSAYLNRPRGNEEGEGTGLENRTRLGSESITLIPLEEVEGGWCVRPGEASFAPDQPLSDSLARRLYDRQLKVSRTALVKRFKCVEVPLAFQHPLLRNCYPLPLRQGRYEEGSLRLCLDDRLGLVYGAADGENEERE
ncbi:CRISPR-associated helicase Cas3' [Stutzerimonas kirkiae]|uniref:CRISPR-associated helicase Cas3' n=1 Tax=Stutzerimonas kirkiae TaxID=2211392 RepID=UPI0010385651|nr:CRISPR-associated helicase Cas3' [Stutzerimonas kirkiae]TBV04966.1 CRISPR-associated helicase/endonuclease Cas3 [Stutzerimonas kirkiae]TBV13723.1 CRISPR-associated helicase/endonuclease Cas3 [Stutzerimonas kirkiae]